MEKQEIIRYVDHTILSTSASVKNVTDVCKAALTSGAASACIMPCYVKQMASTFKGLNICTVVGFPLGYSTSKSKAKEAKNAIKDGANEIDMVINQNYVKDCNFDAIKKEIKLVKKACKNKVLKVIVETCNLTLEEKITLCQLVCAAGANYIKTSTGFGSGGASIEDIKLFKENVCGGVLIKASGGIKTIKEAQKFIEAGASRIGASKLI